MDLDDEIMKGGGILGSAERLADKFDHAVEGRKEPKKEAPEEAPAQNIRDAVKGGPTPKPKMARPARGTGEAKSSRPPGARKKDGMAEMLMRLGLSEKDARTAEKMILVVLLGVLVYFLLRSYGIIG